MVVLEETTDERGTPVFEGRGTPFEGVRGTFVETRWF